MRDGGPSGRHCGSARGSGEGVGAGRGPCHPHAGQLFGPSPAFVSVIARRITICRGDWAIPVTSASYRENPLGLLLSPAAGASLVHAVLVLRIVSRVHKGHGAVSVLAAVGSGVRDFHGALQTAAAAAADKGCHDGTARWSTHIVIIIIIISIIISSRSDIIDWHTNLLPC